MSSVEQLIKYGKSVKQSHLTRDEAHIRMYEAECLLKDIFKDITKDNRLSPDTFDRLVGVLK